MAQLEDLNRKRLEKIAELFRVFSEPTRLAIIQALKPGPKNVNQLVEILGTTQANVSKQLRMMYDANILARSREGNQVFYSIEDQFIHPLCELICDKLNRDSQTEGSQDYSI